jgi:hypothetical protein
MVVPVAVMKTVVITGGGNNSDDPFSENFAGIILVNTILQVEIMMFCH